MIMSYRYSFTIKSYYRGVNGWWAGWAIAHPGSMISHGVYGLAKEEILR
jgi:hypothetical protein